MKKGLGSWNLKNQKEPAKDAFNFNRLYIENLDYLSLIKEIFSISWSKCISILQYLIITISVLTSISRVKYFENSSGKFWTIA